MADVELDDLRHARKRADRIEGEAMAGVDLEPGRGRRARGQCEPLDLARDALCVVVERPLAVGARVQLDDVGAERRRGVDRA